MDRIVQIRLREAGRIQRFKVAEEIKLRIGDCCIIETNRGQEYGEVLSDPEAILDAEPKEEIKKVMRKATLQDKERIKKNKQEAKKAYSTCLEKIEVHKLPMKLVYVEYSFDKNKLIFYFTADGRIDFRELVKDLASIFKARIELRQIGVRDEAKILGGIGCCGRSLCCAKFLKDFEPVNIKMAKIQQLPLNPDKISGVCGRLLCCLKYEYPVYRKYAKEVPIEGTRVKTSHGDGWVKSINILKQEILVDLGEHREVKVSIKDVQIKQKPEKTETEDEQENELENNNKNSHE